MPCFDQARALASLTRCTVPTGHRHRGKPVAFSATARRAMLRLLLSLADGTPSAPSSGMRSHSKLGPMSLRLLTASANQGQLRPGTIAVQPPELTQYSSNPPTLSDLFVPGRGGGGNTAEYGLGHEAPGTDARGLALALPAGVPQHGDRCVCGGGVVWCGEGSPQPHSSPSMLCVYVLSVVFQRVSWHTTEARGWRRLPSRCL